MNTATFFSSCLSDIYPAHALFGHMWSRSELPINWHSSSSKCGVIHSCSLSASLRGQMSRSSAFLPFAWALILVFDRRLVQSTLRMPLRMFYGNLVKSKYVSGQHKCCVVSLHSVKYCSEGVSAYCWNGRLNNGFIMAVRLFFLIYQNIFSHISLCNISVASHCTDVKVPLLRFFVMCWKSSCKIFASLN